MLRAPFSEGFTLFEKGCSTCTPGARPRRSTKSSGLAKASTSGFSKRKVSRGGVGMGCRHCRRNPAMARPTIPINAYGTIFVMLASPLLALYRTRVLGDSGSVIRPYVDDSFDDNVGDIRR